jgi:aryl-alcohol dehydrogenase-like predicted oxidoreductase
MFKIILPDRNYPIMPIGIGTMGYGGYFKSNKTNKNFYLNLIKFAYDQNCKILDTAENYAKGNSEKIIGMLPSNIKNDIFIMTKFSPENSEPKKIENSLNNSLKRLKRDYVDVYFPHWPTTSIAIEVIIEKLLDLSEKGKIKYIGLSNFSEKQYLITKHLTRNKKKIFIQNEYNILERSVEKKLLPKIISKKDFFVAYSPFANGEVFKKNNNKFKNLNLISKECGCTVAQLLLSWILRHHNTIVIPKSESINRIKENLKIFDLNIDKYFLNRISKLFNTEILKINLKLIDIEKNNSRLIYTSIDEAKKNIYNLNPSPSDLAQEIFKNKGKLQKPIKLKKRGSRYILIEGRVKYWAWKILYKDSKPIPSIILD